MEFFGEHVEHAEVDIERVFGPLGEGNMAGRLHGIEHRRIKGHAVRAEGNVAEIKFSGPVGCDREFFHIVHGEGVAIFPAGRNWRKGIVLGMKNKWKVDFIVDFLKFIL